MNFHLNLKKIHIDIDPSSINKNVNVDLALVGDVKFILEKIIASIKKQDQKLLQILINKKYLLGGIKLKNGEKKIPLVL